MESVLAPLGGDDAFDIVWDGEQEQSLRVHKHRFAHPEEAQRVRLADGELILDADTSFVPLTVGGRLRGWIAFAAHVHLDHMLTMWAAQCAATLSLFMPQPRAADHDDSPERSEPRHGEPSNELRFSFSTEELADQIVYTIQGITSTPRVLLGLVDAEHRKVKALSAYGLPPPQREGPGIDFDDWLKMVKRSMPLGAMTFHVGRHPLLPSFTSALVVQIPGPREVPEGVLVVEVGEQHLPLSHTVIEGIENVARQASTALSSARLYTEQQQTVDRLTALNALSLAMSTTQLSVEDTLTMALAGAVGTTGGESGGAVVMWQGRAPETFDSPQGVRLDATWVQQWLPMNHDYIEFDAQILPTQGVQHGLQYVLVAPLRGATLTMGALWIEYSVSAIDQEQREMIVLYAKMAGSVLENMYLDELVVNTRDRLASILRSAHEGMVLLDEHGRVGVANRAFGQLVGVDETSWEGRHIDEFCGEREILGLPLALRVEICDRVNDVLQGRSESATGEITLDPRVLTWQVLPVRSATLPRFGALLVIHDVTAERRMESLRQDLSNMIVHDLRSPLTNIMVSVDLLLKQNTGTLTDSQRRILQIASASCEQMLDMVNALLDIRRLQQQTVELQRQPIEIVDLAEIVLQRLEHVAQDKRVGLDNALAALPMVMADPDMTRRVLQNLVDNALKFSRPGTPVRLTGQVADASTLPTNHTPGRWVVVSVQDRGVGIPEEYHRIIFELFTQAPGGYGRGTGVGLAFCKLAVEAHGGKIWVDSIPGEGATFSFSLPVA
jgi:PAS domain S-box-containing protein